VGMINCSTFTLLCMYISGLSLNRTMKCLFLETFLVYGLLILLSKIMDKDNKDATECLIKYLKVNELL